MLAPVFIAGAIIFPDLINTCFSEVVQSRSGVKPRFRWSNLRKNP